MQFSPSLPSSVIDDAFSLIWPYHDHVQTLKGSKSWYEVVQFILSFSWNFFPPDPCFYVAKGADWKGQVRKNLLCNDYDHIISKLHRDVSAHYPPRTGIQSRRRHLVETLLLILRDWLLNIAIIHSEFMFNKIPITFSCARILNTFLSGKNITIVSRTWNANWLE